MVSFLRGLARGRLNMSRKGQTADRAERFETWTLGLSNQRMHRTPREHRGFRS
jgi:hypothetical protein